MPHGLAVSLEASLTSRIYDVRTPEFVCRPGWRMCMGNGQAEQASSGTKSDTPPNRRPSKKPKAAERSKGVDSKLKVKAGRRRGPKPYPVIPFEQALRIGQ